MKKLLLIIIALALVAASLFIYKPKYDYMTVGEIEKSDYKQTHTVKNFRTKYVKYAKRYFDGKALAYAGETGVPDICIPGIENLHIPFYDLEKVGIEYTKSAPGTKAPLRQRRPVLRRGYRDSAVYGRDYESGPP